jgi:hypothetical protein
LAVVLALKLVVAVVLVLKLVVVAVADITLQVVVEDLSLPLQNDNSLSINYLL